MGIGRKTSFEARYLYSYLLVKEPSVTLEVPCRLGFRPAVWTGIDQIIANSANTVDPIGQNENGRLADRLDYSISGSII